MAAHGLTILRQIYKQVSEEKPSSDILSYIDGALRAPGTCFTTGFGISTYTSLALAAESVERGAPVSSLLPVLKEGMDAHEWMDAYPSVESLRCAFHRYIRPQTPWWRVRLARFDAGDADTHKLARAAISLAYPLDKRAPAILT